MGKIVRLHQEDEGLDAVALPDPADIRGAIEAAARAGDLPRVVGETKRADAIAHAARLALGKSHAARPYVVEAIRGRWTYAQAAGPNPGAGPGRGKDDSASSFDGLEPKQRERWRRLHAIPAKVLEARLARDRDEWPSFAQALGWAREAELGTQRAAYDADPDYAVPVRRGDFRDVLADLEPASVDLVLTDPPYDAPELYGDMAECAARWLRPGGSVVAMCSHIHLPDVFDAMRPHLDFFWTLACMMADPLSKRIPGKWVIAGWKPMVWFTLGRRSPSRVIVDVLRGAPPDNTRHKWAQSLDVVWPIIEAATDPGDLIVDPFAGTGNWGASALAMDRRWIGADVGGAVIV